jgi:hypothetical protein
MTRLLSLVALLAFSLLTGCIQSLHPYYTEGSLTYDAALVGSWADEEGSNFVIKGDAEAKSYEATYTDKEKKTGRFELHLVKVKDQLLIDVAPAEPQRKNESDTYTIHLLPVHSFLLLKIKGANAIEIRTMDYDWLKKHLETNPSAIAHEQVGGDRLLLTAPSEKLQAFVLAHVNTADAYGNPTTFKRASKPDEPAAK